MCSHPASNCELFERFNKSMIMFFTTRLEFGRNDQNINWRKREMGKWNSWGELELRQQELIQFILYHSLITKRLQLVANNKYDVEYVYYYTGIRPKYIPSWCGDLDTSFGRKEKWMGCLIDESNEMYSPIYNFSLIVPYKQMLWIKNSYEINHDNSMYQEFHHAKNEYLKMNLISTINIHHSYHILKNHSPENYKKYKSLIFIPYQSSVMTFFELYRQNIPIFAPSLELLISWHQKYHILSDRIYGWPKRYLNVIKEYYPNIDDINNRFFNIPDPNDDLNITSNEYWFPFCDHYHFPYITYFTNWNDLFIKMENLDYQYISNQMYLYNKQARQELVNEWNVVFKELLPNRKRNYHPSTSTSTST